MRDAKPTTPKDAPQFLKENPKEWLTSYAPGKFKDKRVAMYAGMAL
jgi:hypothetical protein